MYCGNCGNQMQEGAAHCGRCGGTLSPTISQGKTMTYANRPDMDRTQVMPKDFRKTERCKADAVICFDCTGSMQPYIDGMRDMVVSFSRDLENNGVDARLALVEYRDLTIGEDIHTKAFTDNPETFRSWIAALEAEGGGPEPESTIDAVYEALKLRFRPDATRIIAVITDASYHEPAQCGMTMGELCNDVQANKAVVYVIGPDLPGYISLAGAMQGLFFQIDDNPDGFRQTIKNLGKSISETATRLGDVKSAADAALGRTRVW